MKVHTNGREIKNMTSQCPHLFEDSCPAVLKRVCGFVNVFSTPALPTLGSDLDWCSGPLCVLPVVAVVLILDSESAWEEVF